MPGRRRDSLGVDVSGGSPAGDFMPAGPGEDPLDREYPGGPQSRLDAWAGGARQCLLLVGHVLPVSPSGHEVPVQRR